MQENTPQNIVAKFGGSSLADARRINAVASIIKSEPARRTVVVSAPGKRNTGDEKITDLLYALHEQISNGSPSGVVGNIIEERYRGITNELGLAFPLEAEMREMHERANTATSPDYLASRGEYLSAKIVAKALGFSFVDAADHLHFDEKGRFKEARSLRKALNAPSVVPGFYGSMPDGSIKTFSRGGSDVTGAIVAQEIGADVYENWTDTDMRMADPRVVPGALPIRSLTYKEVRELAYAGASILHPVTMLPVQKAGIPIHIRDTFNPESQGTLIVPDNGNHVHGGITGIAGKKGFTAITMEKMLMNEEVGFVSKALSVLKAKGISIEHIASGIDSISIIAEKNILNGKREEILAALNKRCKPDKMTVENDIALIAVVGRGMVHTPGMSGTVYGAMGEADINIKTGLQGASELSIILGVEEKDCDDAIRAIYTAFVPPEN